MLSVALMHQTLILICLLQMLDYLYNADRQLRTTRLYARHKFVFHWSVLFFISFSVGGKRLVTREYNGVYYVWYFGMGFM